MDQRRRGPQSPEAPKARDVIDHCAALVDAGRSEDVDSVLTHAVHAGVRPRDLYAALLARIAEGGR